MVRPIPPVDPVPRLWPNSTVVCLGTGPSLTQADVDFCHACHAHVIAINDAWRLAPWAEVLYAADSHWWRQYQGVPDFHGLKYSILPDGMTSMHTEYTDVHLLRNTGRSGLETEPNALRTGVNSGYQAINLAVHLGASTIILLGYDMQVGADGKRHFFGDHPRPLLITSRFAEFLTHFPTLVEPLKTLNVRVFNATRRTALEVFPKMLLAEALAPAGLACPNAEGPRGEEGLPGFGYVVPA